MKAVYILSLLIPAAAALLLAFRPKLWKGVSVGTAAIEAALCLLAVLLPRERLHLFFAMGLDFALLPDTMGLFFACLFALLVLLALIFNLEYMGHGERQGELCLWFLLTLGSLMGMCFSGNLPTYYMFFECVTLCSFPLVLHNREEASRRAAVKYLCYSLLGAAMVLFGMFFSLKFLTGMDFVSGGSLDLSQVGKAPALAMSSLAMLIFGFGCKAGMMPLHDWLPTAHPEAPATASAILSGVITKAGALGIIRSVYYLYGPDYLRGTVMQYALIAAALVTVFCGSMLAFMEKKLKKRLAYSTVSQVSYALFGIFCLCPAGLEGALLQVVFHGFSKVCLFLCAGAIIHQTGAEYVRDREGNFLLYGIGRSMPLIMLAFSFAALSLVGIPPFGGFAGKWYLASGGFGALGAWGWVGSGVLLISALLTAGYLFDIVSGSFFPAKGARLQEAREPGASMTVPTAVLAVLMLVLGIFSSGLTGLFSALASGLM